MGNVQKSMRKIPIDKLPKFINQLVHVSWANNGCVWRLRLISGEFAFLETVQTKKTLYTNINNLMATRNNEKLLDE